MEKNTFQRLIHMVMAMTAIAILLVSCQQDEWFDPSSDVPEGYVLSLIHISEPTRPY